MPCQPALEVFHLSITILSLNLNSFRLTETGLSFPNKFHDNFISAKLFNNFKSDLQTVIRRTQKVKNVTVVSKSSCSRALFLR